MQMMQGTTAINLAAPLTAPRRRTDALEPFRSDGIGTGLFLLTRFLHANRHPPPDQVEGVTSLENALTQRDDLSATGGTLRPLYMSVVFQTHV